MRMHNPLPPGEIINERGLEPLGLMVTEAVKEAVCARKGGALANLHGGWCGKSKFARAR